MLGCDNTKLEKRNPSNELERSSVKKINLFADNKIRKPIRGQSPGSWDVLFPVHYSLWGNCFLISFLWEELASCKITAEGNLKCEGPRDFSAAHRNFYIHTFTHGYMGTLLEGPKAPGWFSNCVPWLCISNSFIAQLEGEKFRIKKRCRTKYGRK